jgi:hypothetical protein
MEEYHEEFLNKKPMPTINEEYVADETAFGVIVHSGIYTFQTSTSPVKARFTFVYKKQAGGEYKIQVRPDAQQALCPCVALPDPLQPCHGPRPHHYARHGCQQQKLSSCQWLNWPRFPCRNAPQIYLPTHGCTRQCLFWPPA